ncbi:MAG: non-homologous end-joining DNA ligase [Aquihabitans sp.]
MLAVAAPLPSADEDHAWSYEMKWDGMRAIAEARADGWQLMTRSGRDVTRSYPDLGPAGLEALAERLGGRDVILDGEIVATDSDGRPSFARLQQRMNVTEPDIRLLGSVPVSYLVFDLLRLDGTDAVDLPYAERRRLLEALHLTEGENSPIRVPPALAGDGEAALAVARSMGLEGVVAKRLDSPYRSGARSGAWRKIKLLRTQEVVLVGWAEGEGRRHNTVGALLLALPDEAGNLWYCGRVGTGFTDRMLEDLSARLAPLERATSAVMNPPRGAAARPVHWVDPELVGEVVFQEWTTANSLRQPSWRGLRPDKAPIDVTRES